MLKPEEEGLAFVRRAPAALSSLRAARGVSLSVPSTRQLRAAETVLADLAMEAADAREQVRAQLQLRAGG